MYFKVLSILSCFLFHTVANRYCNCNEHNVVSLTNYCCVVLFYFGLQVPITVYYESLCPDSAKFITEQIYPAVKGDLKDHVDINWVPFGKSNVSS